MYILFKPYIYGEKTVYIKTYKTAVNRTVDYTVACARLSDSIVGTYTSKAKIRRARLGKGGGGGGKNERESLLAFL